MRTAVYLNRHASLLAARLPPLGYPAQSSVLNKRFQNACLRGNAKCVILSAASVRTSLSLKNLHTPYEKARRRQKANGSAD